MTDLTKLKELAERALALHGTPSLEHVFAITKFREALEPKAILGLIAEVERLRKDAERYQALRQKDRGGMVVRDRTSHLFGESLDAAIDAALEGGRK
ncbi:hypothetical protein [Pseudomonas sp.]|uniref:hypothetical protein n=1 Tax=Pseudomonas sp. TaxID=306 RepID=UPI0031DAA53C